MKKIYSIKSKLFNVLNDILNYLLEENNYVLMIKKFKCKKIIK